jgi:hypothetical protein
MKYLPVSVRSCHRPRNVAFRSVERPFRGAKGDDRSFRRAKGDHPRGGAAMVFVLILLLVISMISASVVRAAVAQHRQRLRDELRAQTVRLAQAGWQRAVRKLRSDADYAGETWRIESDAFRTDSRAEVRIEIAADENGSARRRLKVVADYPLDHPSRTRLTLEGTVGRKNE